VAAQAGVLTLAPAYDLVDIDAVAHEHMSVSFAMGIGNAFHLEDLTPFEWASMAAQTNVAPKFLATRLKALCEALPRAFLAIQPALQQQGVRRELLGGMEERLARRCSALLANAAEIPRVPIDLL